MISDERVQIALEELQDLKGVWNELLKIWEKLDELKEQPWLSVQPRKVSRDNSSYLAVLKDSILLLVYTVLYCCGIHSII